MSRRQKPQKYTAETRKILMRQMLSLQDLNWITDQVEPRPKPNKYSILVSTESSKNYQCMYTTKVLILWSSNCSFAEFQRDISLSLVSQVHGCLPAMGYSFAAGTTDGPGSFAFEQGTTTSNPLWNMVRNFLAKPTDEDVRCHAAKPILLATGRVSNITRTPNRVFHDTANCLLRTDERWTFIFAGMGYG